MNFQSGKTQAIDLDELNVAAANRPADYKVRDDFELDKWNDDPWATTEEGRKRRRWAEDDKWAGDDEENKQQNQGERWDVDENALKAGWKSPKRGDQLETDEGWDDWGNFSGGPKQLDEENESKDFGGHRRVQAASQYGTADDSNYVDGRQKRDDLYREKEVFGTAGLKERRGDPYAQQPMKSELMPAMQEVGSGWDDVQPNANSTAPAAEDDVKAAKISTANTGGEDIPGVTRASIIVFLTNADPVVCELKKVVTTIGRGEDNLVIVCDQYTSRHHIRLNYVGGRFEMVALSKDNLTTVNGYPASHVTLKHEDQIEIGAARIKFVVGPISELHMQMTPPKNGAPMHIGDAPDRVRSPKTTRKNLIILISVVATFIVILMVVLAILVSGSGSSKEPAVSAKVESADNAKADDKAAAKDDKKADAAASDTAAAAAAPAVELNDNDSAIADVLFESLGQVGGHPRGTSTEILGKKVHFKVVTTPEGARIYNQDGSLRGVTPYEADEMILDGRTENWTIRLDDYKELKQEIAMKQGADLNLTLEKDVAEKAKPAAKPASKPASKPATKKPGGKKPANKRPGGRILL